MILETLLEILENTCIFWKYIFKRPSIPSIVFRKLLKSLLNISQNFNFPYIFLSVQENLVTNINLIKNRQDKFEIWKPSLATDPMSSGACSSFKDETWLWGNGTVIKINFLFVI